MVEATPLPNLLERLGRKIEAAWKRASVGETEWIEGSLELMQALGEARGTFAGDVEFGKWLTNNNHDHWNKNDRAALITMASDLTTARDVLSNTTRRSYQHILQEAKGRFPHVRKPRKGTGKKRTRISMEAKRAAAKAAQEGLSQEDAAKAAGAGSVQSVKQGAAYNEGWENCAKSLLDAAAVEKFTDKGALKIDDAVRVHKARLDRNFEQRVNEEVRRRIEAADDATRAQNKDLRKKIFNLERMAQRGKIFTTDEYMAILRCLHPDSRGTVSDSKLADAFRLFKPKKFALTGEE